MIKSVLDTNVILAGLISRNGASHKILQYLTKSIYKPLISVPLLLEYEEILKREKSKLFISDDEMEAIRNMFAATSEHIRLYYLWRPLLKDPSDEMVLELAVSGNADVIVTFNGKDFKEAERFFDIDIITPARFLELIGGTALWNNIH